MTQAWWKSAVVYQIYPKSFYDYNGDGIGDLAGITAKLDYIQSLGANVIWLCPIFESPMKDNGYDIANYDCVDPIFGDNDDLDELIRQAAQRGIKILLDLVLNHSSNQHPWFKAALADPQSPYADYYQFIEWDHPTPPNNLRTYFDCPVWTQVPNSTRWYFNSFGPEQPDLNWENPQLRKEIIQMINRWIAKGVAGFRIDAIGNIKKSTEALSPHHFPADREDGSASLVPWVVNQPGIHDFLKELASQTFHPANVMTVAEIDVPPHDLVDYIGEDGAFSMVFDFSIADLDIAKQPPFSISPITAERLKPVFFNNQLTTQQVGWGAPYLENHDQPRSLNKFLNQHAKNPFAAKMLATFLLTQRGTPFIYQGQEIGMTNCPMTLDEHDDLHLFKLYQWGKHQGYSEPTMMRYFDQRSRDNARTPFQWNNASQAGFTTGTPWLKVNPNYPEINAAAQQQEPDSLFAFYQQLIHLRRHSVISPILVDGEFSAIDAPASVIAYRRTLNSHSINIYCNFSDKPQPIRQNYAKVHLNNMATISDHNQQIILQPYQSIIFEVEKSE
ncbi:alpha-glucosidase [Providencia alcalifaciens]|uniref:Alpha amylase, catalytic domain protein n=1 Tax=Providencia alcalifaciens DSM 30120 TaxID=520999 RepID=B6XDU3_9GAMM|nr:alpha-glucosidase [Providencia alcalifaciens]ATG15993.1 alpha-glucosidase [Providencia alcalifaciens]EEB46404.1 alpha amylase, catalytic domain protein [Providencia alcalifaciens DSM 30120]SQI41964.1 Oligo-1,6-glucosidase [Providencia alcalifaciens]